MPVARLSLRGASLFQIVIEIALILIILLIACSHIIDFSPDMLPMQREINFLIHPGAVAHEVFARSGAIPLWNPLIGKGEPLFEGPFSFILNPLMTYPILFLGTVIGLKVTLLLHAMLYAVGGWLFGYTLNLRAAARILLALLVAGSASFVSQLPVGFIEIAFSLVYIPFVFAGLWGTLYYQSRAWVGLLIVSSTLMVFTGTVWYVLPTALTALLLTVFSLIRRRISTTYLWRLGIAGGVTLLLCTIRLLPLLLSSDLYYHPSHVMIDTYDLWSAVVPAYFTPEKIGSADWWFGSHYVVPGIIAATCFVVGGALVLWRSPFQQERWRLILPALIAIIVFSAWAQDKTPILQFLYSNTFLAEWRWPVRMAAASSFWIAFLVAFSFDHILTALQALFNRYFPQRRLFEFAAIAAVGVAVWASDDVLQNWRRFIFLESIYSFPPYTDALALLRTENPNGFISVDTEGQPYTITFYSQLLRTAAGNQDTFIIGLPTTIGFPQAAWFPPPYGLGSTDSYLDRMKNSAYTPHPTSPRAFEDARPVLYEQPNSPPYAFVVDRARLDVQDAPLQRNQVTPVTYHHRFDSIVVTLEDYPANAALIIQEVAYPGWSATLNGINIPVESIATFNGVVLPAAGGNQTVVVFTYQAPLIWIGGGLYLIGLFLFSGYVLRLDRFLPVRITEYAVSADDDNLER